MKAISDPAKAGQVQGMPAEVPEAGDDGAEVGGLRW
jgi:hypothetical protein